MKDIFCIEIHQNEEINSDSPKEAWEREEDAQETDLQTIGRIINLACLFYDR